MKKKIKILLFILLFMLPFNVQALTGKTSISCDKTSVAPGGIITCTLRGTVSDGAVSAVSSRITLSSNLTLNTIDTAEGWKGDGDEGVVELYTDENKSDSFSLVTFTIKASSSVTGGATEKITIGSTKFYDEDYEEVAISDSMQSIKITSTINTLSSITLSQGTLSPTFNSNTVNYSATVDSDKVTISANKTDPASTVSGNVGEVSLNYGVNTFKISVTSEALVAKTYTISITRPDNRSTDNKLASLTLNNSDIELIEGQTEYKYEVENDVTEIEVEAILSSEKAVFVEGYAPGVVSLEEGENKVELKVKAENENVATYTLVITRKEAVVNNQDENNTTNNKTNNNTELSNPKTGTSFIYIVVIIFVVSIGLAIYFYKQYQKKQEKDKNEKS